MPKFVCSYAHDIACFADFVVEARNEKAALRKINKALREGSFENVEAVPAWKMAPPMSGSLSRAWPRSIPPTPRWNNWLDWSTSSVSTPTAAFAATSLCRKLP